MSRRHVYYYTILPLPFAHTSARLSGSPADWLPAPATWDGNGWRTDLRTDLMWPANLATRAARITAGQPMTGDAGVSAEVDGSLTDVLLRPVSWAAVSAETWFPVLEADLELADLGGEHCQLSLRGTYRPPLSVVGGAGDRLLGHRVAEATVRAFVLDIADRLDMATLHV